MRRKDRILSQADALQIIDDSQYAVISCIDGDEIFSIPISIVRDKMSIFIHGAPAGSKQRLFCDGKEVSLVCVSYNKVPNLNKAELSAVKNDAKALGSRVFTTEYKSAIAKTNAYAVTDENLKIKALRLLCEKYTPNYMDAFDTALKHSLNVTNIYEFKIKDLSAKAKILPKIPKD
ncbi:MAG: pyridoxamine 5'-phosphate oxidase family protein [Campylobacter sp.]|nr:pyridoxamine 5'-phosphate oxidase family protein [Campylobacter sp.]